MRIVLVGLQGIGRELTKILTEKSENDVALIDTNEKITESIAEEYDAVTITGDGSSPEILRQAKLAEADCLIAVTESDAINLVIAMIAKQWNVKKIAIKLSNPGLQPAGKEIIKDIVTVMPNTSAANEIVQAIYGKEKSNIARLIGGALYQDSLVLIVDLELPDDCLVIAVKRDDQVLLAKGSLKMKKGDRLIFLSEKEESLQKIAGKFKKE
jgi:trk system potassium uptake protein TrkA